MTFLTEQQSRELIRRLNNMKPRQSKIALAKEFNISRETLYEYWRLYNKDDKQKSHNKLEVINHLISQVKVINNYFAEHPDSPDNEHRREELITELLNNTLD